MIQKADLVVANSSWLAEYASQWNPNSADIGQGCNLEAFLVEEVAEPPDMKSIPRPIVGYCGAITSMRLDEKLLIHIAEALPELSLVLVGPSDKPFEHGPLRQMKNVYFLGGKKPEETVSYIHHFTVCINPQLINPLTIGNYPRKIDEYLASGKPVVATATKAMEMFKDYVSLCVNREEYVRSIRKILREPDSMAPETIRSRRQFALGHSWENSIGAMGDAFYSLTKNYQRVEI